MPRAKSAKTTNRKRRKLLRQTKGFQFDRKSKKRAAKQALFKAWTYAFRDRKRRKRDFRRLWNVKINAGVRQHGLNYSKFIHLLKESNITLNRKMLAELAEHKPKVFERVVKTASNNK